MRLDDLRTPTAFTWTAATAAMGCTADPSTVKEDFTWLVEGTRFPAEMPPVQTFSANGIYYFTYTFPGMTVTSLRSEEPITLVELTQRT